VVSGALGLRDWSHSRDGHRGKHVAAQEQSKTGRMEGSNGDLTMYRGEQRGLSMHGGESRRLDPVCIEREWRGSGCAWRENEGN